MTTLAGIDLGLARYDRDRVDGTTLTFEAIERVSQRLAADDLAGRAAHPCIATPAPIWWSAAGAVLEALCRAWPVGSLTVADRGVREGLLYENDDGGPGCPGSDLFAALRMASGGKGKGRGSGQRRGKAADPGSRRLAQKVKTASGRPISSTRWLQRQINDPYVARARAEGYRSRAAL